MNNSNGKGSILGALIGGALAGAALGVLFAPRKGRKTREMITNKSKAFADDLKNKMSDEAALLRAKAQELEDLAKSKLKDITNNKEKHDVLNHPN